MQAGFFYSKSMANFEAFRKVISSNINLLFLKSVLLLENPHFRSCMVDIKEIRTFRSNCQGLSILRGKNKKFRNHLSFHIQAASGKSIHSGNERFRAPSFFFYSIYFLHMSNKDKIKHFFWFRALLRSTNLFC